MPTTYFDPYAGLPASDELVSTSTPGAGGYVWSLPTPLSVDNTWAGVQTFSGLVNFNGGTNLSAPAIEPVVESTTPLTANATFAGASVSGVSANPGYSRFRVFAASDVAGTVTVQQSRTGSVWFTTLTPVVVPAGITLGTIVESLVTLPFVRAFYTNGTTNQTAFELDSALVAG